MSQYKIRHKWMDSLRGLAILLVTNYHITIYVLSARPDTTSSIMIFINHLSLSISPLRMPILVFLSGLLVCESITKGSQKYFFGKLKNILYPFVIWTVIMYILVFLMYYVVGETSDIVLWKALTYDPIYHLWFLLYLFIYYIIIYFINNKNIILTVSLTIASYFLLKETGHFDKFISLFFFFLLGSYIGIRINYFSQKIRSLSLWCFSPIAILAAAIYQYYDSTNNSHYNMTYVLMGLILIPALVKLMMVLEPTRLSRLLEYFGKGSLVVYLLHYPVQLALGAIMNNSYNGGALSLYLFMLVSVILTCVIFLNLRKKYKLVDALFSAEFLIRKNCIKDSRRESYQK